MSVSLSTGICKSRLTFALANLMFNDGNIILLFVMSCGMMVLMVLIGIVNLMFVDVFVGVKMVVLMSMSCSREFKSGSLLFLGLIVVLVWIVLVIKFLICD